MSRLEIHEMPEPSAQMLAEVSPWTELDEAEVYNPETKEHYESLLARARERVTESYVAAALVSAADADLADPYDYDQNAKEALITAQKVREVRDFFQEHPTGEMGLHLGEYHLILFKTDHAKVDMAYNGEYGHHAYIAISAPLQTNIMLHSGELGGHAAQSIQGQEYFGGYQVFSVGFNELRTGVTPKILQQPVDPLVLGRSAINDYFNQQAVLASAEGGTTHRLSSLAYGLWRLRGEDAEIAAAFQETVDAYGLEQLWTDQYRQEIGSKAAHVVLRNMLSKKARKAVPIQEQLMVLEGGIFNDEPNIYGTNPDTYMEAARKNAERIGAGTNEARLRKAVQYVFQGTWG